MTEEELYEQIEAYLAGALSREAQAAFEAQMAADPDLATKVAIHRDLNLAMREKAEMEDLAQKIGQVLTRQRVSEQGGAVPRRMFPFYLVAAAVVLLAAIAIIFLPLRKQAQTPEALFAQHITYPQQIDGISTSRANGSQLPPSAWKRQVDSLWQIGNQQYRTGQYEKAIQTLEQIVALEQTHRAGPSEAAFYYQGMILLKMERYAEAITAFEQTSEAYAEEADWYRALALLMIPSRRTEAEAALRAFSERNLPKSQQADRILQQLQDMK